MTTRANLILGLYMDGRVSFSGHLGRISKELTWKSRAVVRDMFTDFLVLVNVIFKNLSNVAKLVVCMQQTFEEF